MGATVLINMARQNLGKIFGVLAVITVLSVSYFKWESQVCERCTLAERQGWEEWYKGEKAKSDQILAEAIAEKEIEVEKQHQVYIGVLKYYANQIQSLNDSNKRLSNERMFINIKKTGSSCGGGAEGGVPQISTGTNGSVEGFERQEIDPTTGKRIRGYITDTKEQLIIVDTLIDFLEYNNLVETDGTNSTR